MIRCRECGFGNADDSRFCEECGGALPERGGTPTREVAAVDPPTDPPAPAPTPAPLPARAPHAPGPRPAPAPARVQVSTLPVPRIPVSNIALSEGERLWRTYPILHFRPFRPHAKGTLHITDSRILLHAEARKLSGKTVLLEEVRLESVVGFGSYRDRGLGPIGTLMMLLVTFYALRELIEGNRVVLDIIVLVLVGIMVRLYYYYGRMGLRVYTSMAGPGAINFGNFGGGMFRSLLGLLGPLGVLGAAIGGVQATDVLYCFPEANVDEVLAELGALVFDLNTKGTLVDTQWETS